MGITTEDRLVIAELLAMHGHLCDSGELDRLSEVFTTDVTYDVTDLGSEPLIGVQALAAAGRALGDLNPVGHHVTNIVVTAPSDGQIHVRSKGIGINADGTCTSVTYEDTVIRVDDGWRISYRKVSPRRSPLGG